MPALADLALAAGMAFLAGATDIYGLGRLHDLFVSFMSGNTTMLAVALGQADWLRMMQIGGIIALFVAGAAAGAALGLLSGRASRPAVSAAVTVVLAVPLLLPGAEIACYIVAMGALNASMNSAGGIAVSLTYVTGALVKIGLGIGRALCGRHDDLGWIWQVPLWISLLLGAVAAFLLRARLGEAALWPLPLFAALLTLGTLARGRDD